MAAGRRWQPWARFAQRHLFDYNAAATRRWLALLACGALCAAWAANALLAAWPGWAAAWAAARGLSATTALLQVPLGVAFVLIAAWFPVHIPRTKYSFGVADVAMFTLLALHGAPAAAVAAGAEGIVGACRTSKRLTSRLSTPSSALLAMSGCGLLFDLLQHALAAAGLPLPVAAMAALCLSVPPYFAGSTLPLLAVMAAKHGQRLSLRDWARDYGWLAAIYLVSAAIAGLLAMNTRQFGPTVMLVAAAVAAAVVGLSRQALARREAERAAHEATIAQAQHEAELSRQRFIAAFTHAAIGMAIVRPDGGIRQVNQALCTLLGRPEAALLEQPFIALLHPGDAALFRRHAEGLTLGAGVGTAGSGGSGGDSGAADPGNAGSAGTAAGAMSMELRCLRADGSETWVALHCGRFVEPAGASSGLIYQLHDITSRRVAEGRLQHIAYHDSLTDLANRNCFNERLADAVERSRGNAAQRFAVMFLDLDRFKVVNDSLGHSAGNALLGEVARRLVAGVRTGDLVARLGGDEFAVLLEQVDDPADAVAMANRLLRALSAPMMLQGTEVQPGASLGLTFSDLGYRSAEEVLRDADLAMYAAKADGRQRVALFDVGMHERIAEKLRLEGDLRRAIGDGQLSLAFQPLYALEPYGLIGFEALARWEHPQRGAISPAVFIALAEESGHIEALTAWVIDQAAGQLARWHSDFPHMAHLGVNVNISGRDLSNVLLVPQVRELLLRHRLAARHLTLEITETTLMGRLEQALDALHALRKVGVKFSIDDFGTGYSSLAYLSTLPIDSLKIDRSFVMGMSQQAQNVEIVRAVLDLGRSLGKTVVAEGIETVAQLATLKALGVHVGQGYLLSRPLRADQVPALFSAAALEPA